MRTLEVLESALRAWETSWSLANNLKLSVNGVVCDEPVRDWAGFRRFLLNLGKKAAVGDSVDISKFGDANNPPPIHPFLTNLPSALTGWCLSSRRVFSLSQTTQLLLGNTSLGDICLDDLGQPFDSYAVELAEPISISDQRFNLVVIGFGQQSGHRPGSMINLYLFNQRLKDYKHLAAQEHAELIKLHRRGQLERANQILSEYRARTVDLTDYKEILVVSIDEELANLPLGRALAEAGKRELAQTGVTDAETLAFMALQMRAFEYALHITAGLCLYLQTLQPGPSLQPGWERNKPAHSLSGVYRGTTITDGAEICTVSSQICLSEVQTRILKEEGLGGTGTTKSPHFRSGYWARPIGSGNDPAARKTVWHRPTFVNSHLIGERELPRGATTIIN